MNTHVAKLIAFSALLNRTDLLAPNANMHVITIVIPNAIKSGEWPNNVPTDSAMLRRIDPPDNELKLALRAHAHALVPISWNRFLSVVIYSLTILKLSIIGVVLCTATYPREQAKWQRKSWNRNSLIFIHLHRLESSRYQISVSNKKVHQPAHILLNVGKWHTSKFATWRRCSFFSICDRISFPFMDVLAFQFNLSHSGRLTVTMPMGACGNVFFVCYFIC